MTTTSRIEKQTWHQYFDNVSKTLNGKLVEIEIDSLAIGVQTDAEWLPLMGITYEPGSDTIQIMAEGLNHFIGSPKEIYVENNGVELLSVEVIDVDDVKQIIKLRDPLPLPVPPLRH